METFKMRWLVLIMAVALGCMEMHAQSDYHERQAKSHVNERRIM